MLPLIKLAHFSTYTLYISKYIRPGFEISYTFNLLDAANPVTLTSRLESSDQAFSEEVVSTVEVGKSIAVSIYLLLIAILQLARNRS